MYYNGKFVEQNFEKAFEWLSKAAEQGFPLAQDELERMHDNGELVNQNFEKALE
ncbi:MAG: hypothetical protein LBR91_03130 [Puniceicoccales bacterium]|jgi:TPR repeat protein|nr:hypothetical protein [Puniceicoccales bacterium]